MPVKLRREGVKEHEEMRRNKNQNLNPLLKGMSELKGYSIHGYKMVTSVPGFLSVTQNDGQLTDTL